MACLSVLRIAAATAIAAQLLSAQSAPQPDPAAVRAQQSADALDKARALIAAGDSVQATKLLRDATARDADNGPLWYEYGKLLSERTRFAWRRGFMPAGIPNMIIAAESSLARAARLSPDSLHYLVDYGRHLWGTNVTSISKATSVQQTAIERFGEGDDPKLAASAADNIGVMMWRRFEALIGRGDPTWESIPSLTRAGVKDMVRYIKDNYAHPDRLYGVSLYNDAVEYLRFARISDPDNEAYFRHEMMALGELKRWMEMGAISRERISQRRQQPWPWLTLGISEHRLGRMKEAQVAFDSGFARLSAADRQRLESLIHILPLKRKAWYDSLARGEKVQLEELYWNTANPSLLLDVNPMHAEFRARAVWAELRYTDDEKGVHGANADKGVYYIRYGPPDFIWQIGDYNKWYYFDELMVFTFQQFRLYGTGYLTDRAYDHRIDLDNDRPATFTNLPILRHRVDSVSTQVVRFRATEDSIDVAVFAGIRAGAVRRGSPIETSTIRHGLFVLDARGRPMTRLAGSFQSSEQDTTVMHAQNYFVRTATTANAVRVEALEPELLQVARSIRDITFFSTKGFGVSDLLLASSVTPPPAASGARWNSYQIAPLTGNVVKRGDPVALIWESYEAAGDSTIGRLQVSVQVQRETPGGLVALTGKVIAGIREAMGGRRQQSGVVISYDREFPATPVLVDHLTIDLGALEPGLYRVSLTVTNAATRSVVQRSQRFRIVP